MPPVEGLSLGKEMALLLAQVSRTRDAACAATASDAFTITGCLQRKMRQRTPPVGPLKRRQRSEQKFQAQPCTWMSVRAASTVVGIRTTMLALESVPTLNKHACMHPADPPSILTPPLQLPARGTLKLEFKAGTALSKKTSLVVGAICEESIDDASSERPSDAKVPGGAGELGGCRNAGAKGIQSNATTLDDAPDADVGDGASQGGFEALVYMLSSLASPLQVRRESHGNGREYPPLYRGCCGLFFCLVTRNRTIG